MRLLFFLIVYYFFCLEPVFSQDVYRLDATYPVHELDDHLLVYKDSTNEVRPIDILKDSIPISTVGDRLPNMLDLGTTYWAKLKILTNDSLKGWRLHFQDKRIGPPAWTKSNGKVDVYAYVNNELIFHYKTGVSYSRKMRDTPDHWVLNNVKLSDIPMGVVTTLIIRVEGNNFGYPAYFNLTARSPSQQHYHQIYQRNNAFNIFMFGVTFIIFLYHLLQFFYARDKVYLWFSIWLLFCTLTQAMTIGFIISDFPSLRYPIWMFIAHGIFFSFWFFGRSFINSKEKFPKIDRLIVILALFVLIEVIAMTLYVLLFKSKVSFTGPPFHYKLLSIYAVASIILSLLLTLKKDLFARYFGIGSLFASLCLFVGTLWSMGAIRLPVRVDPYATGIFFQIVIYSFGIAFRRQKMLEQIHLERLEGERSMAEVLRMKDLDSIKTRFFANVSHEFRTPLTLISGPLQQVNSFQDDGTGDLIISRKTINIIKKNTKRLQVLVDQLLDISKIESGNLYLTLSQGGLTSFIRSHVFAFESMAERNNISLNTHFSVEVKESYYDKDKLEKIVTNLLSNAFKYTPHGGSVHFSLSYDQNYLIIEISDSGMGIAKEEVDRIFDRFYRVEGTEVKGSGIGLALTKELVDLHNGQISVQSEKGKGTKFKVRIPITLSLLPKSILQDESKSELNVFETLEEHLDESQETENRVSTKKNRYTLLLVEDNTDLQSYMTDLLQPRYKVLLAIDGLQGERMAFEHIPDIIVSDIMMPKKDGYELCNNLKQNIKTSHIPIIMLTAKAGQSSKIEGLTHGADAYLTKPFDAQELLLTIQNLIKTREKIWSQFKSLDLASIDDLDLKSVDDIFIQKVIKTIKDNLDNESLSVEDIALQVGFSRAQLHRKLKALVNKSAGQFVTEIRLNEAKKMLMFNTGTVSEVAYSVGYTNMSYFTKSFKDKFGIVPSKVNRHKD